MILIIRVTLINALSILALEMLIAIRNPVVRVRIVKSN